MNNTVYNAIFDLVVGEIKNSIEFDAVFNIDVEYLHEDGVLYELFATLYCEYPEYYKADYDSPPEYNKMNLECLYWTLRATNEDGKSSYFDEKAYKLIKSAINLICGE